MNVKKAQHSISRAARSAARASTSASRRKSQGDPVRRQPALLDPSEQRLPLGHPLGNGMGTQGAGDRIARLGRHRLRVARAARAAPIGRIRRRKRAPHMVELGAESGELADLRVEAVDFVVDQRRHTRLHRRTRAFVPQHDEVADLVEAQTEALGPGDEGEPVERSIVVHAVAARRPAHGRQKAHALVIAERRGRKSRLPRQLGDQQVCHRASVEVEPRFKVKERAGTRREAPARYLDSRDASTPRSVKGATWRTRRPCG